MTRLYSPLAVVVRSREPSLKLSHFKLVCGGSFYNEAFFGIPYNLIFERLDDTNLDRWYNTKNEIKIESNIFEEALRIPGKEEWWRKKVRLLWFEAAYGVRSDGLIFMANMVSRFFYFKMMVLVRFRLKDFEKIKIFWIIFSLYDIWITANFCFLVLFANGWIISIEADTHFKNINSMFKIAHGRPIKVSSLLLIIITPLKHNFINRLFLKLW